MNGLADGTLARQAASGDRAAFAALYDRFNGEIYGFSLRMLTNRSDAADVTQDVFVRAIEKLPQLREPDRVRAWLFTIARHECFARTKRRGRIMATDPLDLGAETASTSRSTAGVAEANELTQLVWDAAKGLASEDRAVLDLKLKRDLDGAELAEALGVPHDQLHKVTARAMERFERSVISLVLARGARKDCSVLAGLLESNGTDEVELTPVLRKRIARHAQDCDACERRRKMLVNPSTMVASAHEVGPSAALRDRVLEAAFCGSLTGTSALHSLSWRGDGFPKSRSRKRKLAAIAALVCVLIGGLFASGLGSNNTPKPLVVSQSNSPETTVARTPSTVAVVSSVAPSTVATPTVAAPRTLAAAVAPTIPIASTSSSTSTAVSPTTLPSTTVVSAAAKPNAFVVPSTRAVSAPNRAFPRPTTSLLAIPTPPLAPKPTTKPTVPPTTRKPKLIATATLKPRATTKPALATPTNPSAALPIEVPVPPTVDIISPTSPTPAIIFPDAVPLEPARGVTTAPSQSTAAPVAVAASTTATPTPSPTTTIAIVTTTTQASPIVTQSSITTTTLKCSLTQAGCVQQPPPPTTTTTTIALRLTPVCCLTTVNPGILFTTTTKASVLIK